MSESRTQQAPVDSADRAAREREAWDHGDWEFRRAGSAFWYVRRSPNSLRCVQIWQDLVRRACEGRAVLDLGCGNGGDCRRLNEWGAREVHGLEVSSAQLDIAREYEGPTVKFFEHDLHQPWPHRYDLIIGRSVLHHLDYQEVLQRLYRDNLRPGGRMVFIEPLGQGLLMRAYWMLGTRFHTPDERPFRKPDIRWLSHRFPGFRFTPINYASLPASVVSWALKMNPDNVLTRLADRIDTYLTERVSFMRIGFRSAIFEIPKPAEEGPAST